MPQSTQRKDWADLWQHESELINHRLTWLGFVQSLLLAAYVLSAREKINIQFEIALLGTITTAALLVGILGAVIAQLMISKKLDGVSLGIHWFTTAMGWTPPVVLPSAFLIGWLFLVFCPPVLTP